MKLSRRTSIALVALLVAVIVGGVLFFLVTRPSDSPAAAPSTTTSATPSPTPTLPAGPYTPLDEAAIAALPEAKYNAVISGLFGYTSDGVPPELNAAYTITADAPLYGEDRTTPVARLTSKNFLGDSTVVVPVQSQDGWSLVLTPSRQTLPSADPDAPAQTVGWLRTDLLTKAQDLVTHIVISVSEQTISVEDASGNTLHSFEAAVGAPETPTPTGVVGYVQARYLDPAQDQTVYPITLSSMHSDAADEPFGGTDGGLIGIHYYEDRSGAISHGCVRVSGDAITTLDQLPLGTPIIIEP